MKRTKELYMLGIGIWIGAGVYSLINMIMNLKQISQSHILNYNYIITGVAVIPTVGVRLEQPAIVWGVGSARCQ